MRLPQFELIVRQVAKTIGPHQERFFLGMLASRLRGNAAIDFGPRMTQFSSVDRFLVELAQRYGNIKSIDVLTIKLKMITQHRNERVS